MNVFFAFILIGIFLLVARFIKQQVKLLQDLYIPESIIAGTLALFLGREVLGAGVAPDSYLAGGLFPETVNNIWQQIPGVFINIVFAALFLGSTIPHPRDIWRKTAPQVAFSYCLAWGQYIVGILLTMLVLVPFFHLDPVAATLIEIAFEGGHGTAAGMADTLRKLNFPEGGDLGLGLATVGIISGMIIGTILANWGRSKGYLAIEGEKGFEVQGSGFKEEKGEVLLVDPLSLNFGLTGLAVAIAWLMLQGLGWLEAFTWGRIGLGLVEAIPLFPFALIGGIIVQLFLSRFGWENLVSRELQERIGGLALDVVVITAIASINLTLLGSNLAPFVLISVTGIAWNVFAFLYLAPRLLPNYWFPRGMADLGQSMGVTATGILLLRMVDPDNRSGAFESFAYKQLFFEPIMGGGLFTAIAPTLIYQFGLLVILLITVTLFAFSLVFGMINYNRR